MLIFTMFPKPSILLNGTVHNEINNVVIFQFDSAEFKYVIRMKF